MEAHTFLVEFVSTSSNTASPAKSQYIFVVAYTFFYSLYIFLIWCNVAYYILSN